MYVSNAVTGLSVLPHHELVQGRALDSWKEFGLTINVVATASHREQLKDRYPQVDRWIVEERTSRSYEYPTQRIKRLAMVSADLEKAVMLINSDIEIRPEYGPYGGIAEFNREVREGTLTVGIRWNMLRFMIGSGKEYVSSSREPWGLDVFVLSPEMAESLPELDFAIGRPVWDYWLPMHFRELGYDFNFIGEKLFFHMTHPVHWSQQSWYLGAKWLDQEYGQLLDMASEEFRNEFPYGPGLWKKTQDKPFILRFLSKRGLDWQTYPGLQKVTAEQENLARSSSASSNLPCT